MTTDRKSVSGFLPLLGVLIFAPSFCWAQTEGLSAQLERLNTIATNRSMAPIDFEARIAAAAELLALTNDPNALIPPWEPPQARVRPPARWVRGPKGFFTENTKYSASVTADLSDEDSVMIAVPDAETPLFLRLGIKGLAYREEGDLGRTVLIAKVKPTHGEVVGHRLVYEDSFEGDGVVASVVYEITPFSIAQDVVVHGRLPEPEYFGLDSSATLTIISEFYDAPEPRLRSSPEHPEDQSVQWGRMGMLRGKAFALGEEVESTVDVDKKWLSGEETGFLLESVPYRLIGDRLRRLPVLKEIPGEKLLLPPAQRGLQGSLNLNHSPDALLAGTADLLGALPGLSDSLPCPLDPDLVVAGVLEPPGIVLDWDLALGQPLINVDFGVPSGMVGYAACGHSTNDFWNVCQGAMSRTISLLDSETNATGATLTLQNAGGNWSFTCCMPSINPMYDTYAYNSGARATVTINSLPAGRYNFYLYGHGPSQAANTIFTIVCGAYTNAAATDEAGQYWNTANWTSEHFRAFENVQVQSGQPVVIYADPGTSGYTILNGVQIVRTDSPVPPPVITLQPQPATVGYRGAVEFRVDANGTAPVNFQWRKDGATIPGATDRTYTIIDVQYSHAGNYSAAVTDAGGTTISGNAYLTVTSGSCLAPPSGSMGWWPGNDSTADLARGHTAQRPAGNGYAPGVATNAFSLTGSGGYCVVPSTSDLNVGSGPGLTLEAWVKRVDNAARPVLEWGSSTMTAVHMWSGYPSTGTLFANLVDVASGTHMIQAANALPLNAFVHVALTFESSSGIARLYRNGLEVSSTNVGAGIQLRTAMDFHVGYRPAGGNCFNGIIDEPSVYNRALNGAEIQAIFAAGANGKCAPAPPSITIQPANQTVDMGRTASFSVGATGTLPLNYQWSKGTAELPGKTSSQIIISPVQLSDAGDYSVRVWNTWGSTNSVTASLTIRPYITAQPTNQAVRLGGSIAFSVTALGTAPLTYQWMFNGTNIAGATGTSHTVSSAQLADAGNYSVRISNSGGTTNSANAFLTMIPYITVQPQSRGVGYYGNTTITFACAGTEPLSYQWMFNGSDIPGATAGSYPLICAQLTNAGNYSVRVWSVGGSTNSTAATVWIMPFITTQPQSQMVYSGTNVTVSVVANGTPPFGYQWRYNGVNISGATAASFTLNNVQPANAGNYSVVVTNAGGSITSQNAALTVYDTADPDYDGIPTWKELADQTNPADPTSRAHLCLGIWTFDDTQTWAANRGQMPTTTIGLSPAVGVSTNAVEMNNPVPARLTYRDSELNGIANIACRSGSVRFWFKPSWSSLGLGGSGPEARAVLLAVGNPQANWWALLIDAQGTEIRLVTAQSGQETTHVTAPIAWAANQWHQIALTYSPSSSKIYLDAALAGAGSGVTTFPTSAERAASGMMIGSDSLGASQIKGALDSIETFNYFLKPGDVDDRQPQKTAVAPGVSTPKETGSQPCFYYDWAQKTTPTVYLGFCRPEPVAQGTTTTLAGELIVVPGWAVQYPLPIAWGCPIKWATYGLPEGASVSINWITHDGEEQGSLSVQPGPLSFPIGPTRSRCYSFTATVTPELFPEPQVTATCVTPITAYLPPMNRQIGYWSFDSGLAGRIFASANSPAFPTTADVRSAHTPFGLGLSFGVNAGSDLRYRAFQSNPSPCPPDAMAGAPAIARNEGTIRFWYSPSYDSGSVQSSGYLLDMGLLSWSLKVTQNGQAIELVTSRATGVFDQEMGGETTHVFSPVAFAAQQWYEIAITYSPSASILYINGVKHSERPGVMPLQCLNYVDAEFAFGCRGNGVSYASGTFDELETFGIVLSESQIAAHYEGKIGASPDSDSDGSTDWEEHIEHTDPFDPDSDADGVPDGPDSFPTDPRKWDPPSNDSTPPIIDLKEPISAIREQ